MPFLILFLSHCFALHPWPNSAEELTTLLVDWLYLVNPIFVANDLESSMQMSQAHLFEYFRSNNLLALPWAPSKFASWHKLPKVWSLPFPAIALKFQSALYGHANILGANRVEGKQMVRGDL